MQMTNIHVNHSEWYSQIVMSVIYILVTPMLTAQIQLVAMNVNVMTATLVMDFSVKVSPKT